jgi:anti-anti-sigma regulatory factor
MKLGNANGKRIVIHVDGVLDVAAAQRITQSIADVGEVPVRIDLTRVRDFHDFGVVILARSLAGREGASVVGLRQHHERLLRYLGIDAGGADLGAPAELV